MLDFVDGVADVAGEQGAVLVVGIKRFHGENSEMCHRRVRACGAVAFAHDDARPVDVFVLDLVAVDTAKHGDQHLHH